MLSQRSAPVFRQPQDDPERLLEEIARLETRLAEIGHDGDCAYEKAMIRFFRAQVETRRERLSRI
jgi:hypothetical protein